MAQLTRFAVVRLIHPVAAVPWPPLTIVVPPTQPGHQSEAIPPELLEAVTKQGRHLEDLCLDWWELKLSDLEAILYACPKMRKLQVAVKSSVLEIVSMSAAFGNVPSLVELAVTSKTPFQNSAAKTKTTKAKKDAEADLPPFLAERVAEGDTTLVEVRDLRKFVRRLPNFRLLRWIGRHGKGEWRFPAVRKTTLVPVDFVHSAQLTLGVWEECQRDPPSFKFEDDPVTYQTAALEPPASPTTPDVPPLTRSTTWSSAASLASASPTTSQPPPRQRRPSSTNGSSGSTSVLGLEWEALPTSIPPVPPHPPLPPVQAVPRLSMPPLPVSPSAKKTEMNGHSRVRSQSSAKGQTPLPVSTGRAPRERKSTKPGKTLAYTPGSTMNDVTQKHVPGAAARKSTAPTVVIGRGGATPTPPRDEATPSDSGSDGWTVVRGVDGRAKGGRK